MLCKASGCKNEAANNQLLCSSCRKIANKKHYQKKKNVQVERYIPQETRKCSNCELTKDINEYRLGSDRTRRYLCIKCENEKSREYAKDKNSAPNIRRYWLYRQKLGKACMYCGYDKPWALDFHHKDPSTKDINLSSIGKFESEEAALKEIEKCDIVCSNCHRGIHTERIPPRPTVEWETWKITVKKAETHPCPICLKGISMSRRFCGECTKLKKMWKLIPKWTYYEMLDQIHRHDGIEGLSEKIGVSSFLLEKKLESLRLGIS